MTPARKVGTAGGVAAAVIALATPSVMKFEGYRQDPYRDVAGVMTVCYGETSGVQNRRYTVDECRVRLSTSLATHASEISSCYPLSSPVEVQAAYLSLAYNIGSAAFCSSTVSRRAKAGDMVGACNAILMWNKAKNRLTGRLEVWDGLTKRRNAERTLCLAGVTHA